MFPHEVRWFYKAPGKFWQPMKGADSLLLEQTYLSEVEGQKGAMPTTTSGYDGEEVVVMGGMYVVDIPNRKMKPIYWAGEKLFLWHLRYLRGNPKTCNN